MRVRRIVAVVIISIMAVAGVAIGWAYVYAQPEVQTTASGAFVTHMTIQEATANSTSVTATIEVLLGGLPSPVTLIVDVELPFGENPSQLTTRIADAIVAQAQRFGYSLSSTRIIMPAWSKG